MQVLAAGSVETELSCVMSVLIKRRVTYVIARGTCDRVREIVLRSSISLLFSIVRG
ncbi:hypothetical protein CT19425_U530008 [Cupriavidus taiwanensis]|uniref:Uncharacterized protein n=1 Tax=Cupriavidus taiwanensis TaxID=164546 RepID=A0A375I8M5_9BURK|nr:hypothetical protein CT19425_U530008 [Cupriavidus taiwanensis]